MSRSRLEFVALLALTPLFTPSVGFADDAAKPTIPASVSPCVSCHSADGNPLVAGVPILAGQRQDYLVSAMKSYRSGYRSGGPADVMRYYAKTLSDDEIEEIAKWFSTN